jgi:glucan 1,3-beta-glucosidase
MNGEPSRHFTSVNNRLTIAGVMGIANAQRALEYIRTLAQFISQPEYKDVVTIFGIINEPNANLVGKSATGSLYVLLHNLPFVADRYSYYEAYQIVREITGLGEGNGAMVSVHDGFLGVTQWYDFLRGADRLQLDQHTYMVSLGPLCPPA